MAKKLILVIDDEKSILQLIQYNLEREGYQVLTAATGEQGLELARAKKPDLLILDLMLPGMDGLEVYRILRANKETKHLPILMLTAKASEVDQIVGLELGASDYIPKPFSVKVLAARVKNVLRNLQSKKEETTILECGDLTLNRERHEVTLKGKPLSLTKLEFNLLAFFMENPGKVYSRDQLLNQVWPGEAFIVDRTVDVHVKSIRRKLGKSRELIETVRGSGYRFSDTDD